MDRSLPGAHAIACLVAVLAATTAVPSLAGTRPVPVSPGSRSSIAVAASSCPTFSWVDGGVVSLELVVAALDSPAAPVIVERVPAGATSWTPNGDDCLAAGRYVWFLRKAAGAVSAKRALVPPEGLAFEIAALPSREELERSLRVVARYLEATGSGAGEASPAEAATAPDDGAADADRRSRSVQAPALAPIAAAINLANAAISGHYPGATGSHVGVAGIVDSADAAGVAAENTAGGADLVLAGTVPAAVTESQWVLDDSSAQTFAFDNPSGDLTVQVEGEDVLTSGDIGTSVAPNPHSHFGASWSGSGQLRGLFVTNSDASSFGIVGRASAAAGIGVAGEATDVSGGAGVLGTGVGGPGLSGYSSLSHGVRGETGSSGAAGGIFVNTAGGPLIAGFDADPAGNSPVFEVDNGGAVTAISFAGDGSGLTGVDPDPPSVFGSFGGPGGPDRTIAGTENLGTTLASYHDLTVPSGATLVIDHGIGFISATGTCTIDGTITASGKGKPGGAGGTGVLALGKPGYHSVTHWNSGPGSVGNDGRLPAEFAVAGGGGGGGGAGPWASARGGAGGGACSNGGFGGCTNCFSNNGGAGWNDGDKRTRLTGGNGSSDFFALFLHAPGAGGGGGGTGPSGGTGGDGGAGGGIVYLECASVSFTGSIAAAGNSGVSGSGDGGGGGGGGGGVALIRAREVLANSGSIVITGGAGGSGSGTGGSGGAGVIGFGAVVDL